MNIIFISFLRYENLKKSLLMMITLILFLGIKFQKKAFIQMIDDGEFYVKFFWIILVELGAISIIIFTIIVIIIIILLLLLLVVVVVVVVSVLLSVLLLLIVVCMLWCILQIFPCLWLCHRDSTQSAFSGHDRLRRML